MFSQRKTKPRWTYQPKYRWHVPNLFFFSTVHYYYQICQEDYKWRFNTVANFVCFISSDYLLWKHCWLFIKWIADVTYRELFARYQQAPQIKHWNKLVNTVDYSIVQRWRCSHDHFDMHLIHTWIAAEVTST